MLAQPLLRPRRRPPCLTFAPLAWLKLQSLSEGAALASAEL